jgi:anthranilate synthase component 1
MSQVTPDKTTFKKLAKSHNLIVLSRKFYCDWLTPLAVYHALSKSLKGEKFLLESLEGEDKICRYSFMGFKAISTFKTKGEDAQVTGLFAEKFKTQDPLADLKKLMARFSVAPLESLRFFGGFVGYLGYDLVSFYEPIKCDKRLNG